jgi:hypothetical protein
MHQNIYNHDKSEPEYKKHISNIAYRFKFKVIYNEEEILKEENNEITVVATTRETPRNTLCYKAWLRLREEYGYNGI